MDNSSNNNKEVDMATIIEMGKDKETSNKEITEIFNNSNNLHPYSGILPSSKINSKNGFACNNSNNEPEPSKLFFEAIQLALTKDVLEYFQNLTLRPWEWVDEEGYTCLHRACFMNLSSIIVLIIQEIKSRYLDTDSLKQFIDKPALNGSRAIHFSSYRGNIDVIHLLIENGADINLTNNRGLNVLHMAAQGDQPGPLILFKEKFNFDLEQKDLLGNTALHWACYMGSEVFFSFILSYTNEINLNVKDDQGLAPLHLAVISEKTKLIKKLLHKGSDRNIKDNKNRTPFALAVEKNKITIIEMLQEEQSFFGSVQCVMKQNLEKTERSAFNLIFFIILHIVIQTGVFLLILPHFKWFILSIIYVSVFALVMLFFMILCCSNPGYQGYNLQNYSENDHNIHPRKLLLQLIERKVVIDDYCPFCIIKKNEVNNIRHCYYCNRCIRDFDHHCYWVNNCIGGSNINLFFVFLTCVVVNLLFQISVGLRGIFIQNEANNVVNPPNPVNPQIDNKSMLDNDSNIYFPPYIEILRELHLYDKDPKIILCSILIIISLCFIMPVLYLWAKNLKYLCLKLRKQKKKETRKFDSIIERVHDTETEPETGTEAENLIQK